MRVYAMQWETKSSAHSSCDVMCTCSIVEMICGGGRPAKLSAIGVESLQNDISKLMECKAQAGNGKFRLHLPEHGDGKPYKSSPDMAHAA